MIKTLKNRKGVTLVELLAVLVILGIIAAIAIPTIGTLIERSRQKAAEASFTSVLEGARIYASDHVEGDMITMDDIGLTVPVTLYVTDEAEPTDEDYTAVVSTWEIFIVTATSNVAVDWTEIDTEVVGNTNKFYILDAGNYYLVYPAE
jgi:type IV pilus assembly protein PilA